MAINIGTGLRALHTSSKTITDDIKGHQTEAADWWDSEEAEPAIPHPSLFEHLQQPTTSELLGSSDLPTVTECAVHLELLEALFFLRQRVLKSEALDAVFGIRPEHQYVDRLGKQTILKDTTMWTRRQVKWEKFIELAVVRFLAWWEDIPTVIGAPEDGNGHVEIKDKELPPLGACAMDGGHKWRIVDVWHRCHHGLAFFSIESSALQTAFPEE